MPFFRAKGVTRLVSRGMFPVVNSKSG